MLYSFDIFDTCLVRLCGEPENMIDVLSYKVVDLINSKEGTCHKTSEHLRRLFVEARRNTGGQLENVYQHVARIFPLPCSSEEMAQLEMDTERELLVPVLATRQLVNQLRSKGEIAFLSDMYLPTSFLREQLKSHGFFKDGDRIFVSDDLNAWKRDGSLYKHVHKQAGVPYKRWHHYGDNLKSDVQIPRRLGIHAHHLEYKYIHYENKWLKQPTLSNKSMAIMAGLSRAIRLSIKADRDQSAFVTDISAPFQCIWMSHVLQDAKKRNIEKIFFCARDVHSAYRVARTLKNRSSEFNNIEITYFFTSQIAVSEGGDLADRYYRQIGLIPTEHVAIVDSRTRGWSLMRLQNAVSHGEYPPFMAYYWHLDTREKECRQCLANYPTDSLYHIGLIVNNPWSKIATIASWVSMIEYGFSINHHHNKTVSYRERSCGRIGPVFAKGDNAYMPNVKQFKRDNDSLLESYAKGFVSCQLTRHTDTLMQSLLIPTLIDFTSSPQKRYLQYLTKICVLGANHPYVCSVFKSNNRKGRWLLGSIVYSLPSPLDRIYCKLRYTKTGRTIRKWISRRMKIQI